MDFRLITRLSSAPLMIGLAGAAVAYVLADSASALGFASGATLVALAMLVSGGFFVRVRVLSAGPVLIRIAISSALRWLVLMGGAYWALAIGGLQAAAFTSGVIAGLVSTLFTKAHTSTDTSTT